MQKIKVFWLKVTYTAKGIARTKIHTFQTPVQMFCWNCFYLFVFIITLTILYYTCCLMILTILFLKYIYFILETGSHSFVYVGVKWQNHTWWQPQTLRLKQSSWLTLLTSWYAGAGHPASPLAWLLLLEKQWRIFIKCANSRVRLLEFES